MVPPLHFCQSIDSPDPTPRLKLFGKGSFYEESPHCPLLPGCSFVLITPCFAHHVAVVVVNKNNKIQNLPSSHLAKMFKLGNQKVAGPRRACAGAPSFLGRRDIDSGAAEQDERTGSARLRRASQGFHQAGRFRCGTDDLVAATPGAIGFVTQHSIN